MSWKTYTSVTSKRDLLTLREVADQLSIDASRLALIGKMHKIPYWHACVPREKVEEARGAGNGEERLGAIRGAIAACSRSIHQSPGH